MVRQELPRATPEAYTNEDASYRPTPIRQQRAGRRVLAQRGRTAEQLQCASLVRRNAGEAASGLARCHPPPKMHSRRPDQARGRKGAHKAAATNNLRYIVQAGKPAYIAGRSVPRWRQAQREASDKPKPAITAWAGLLMDGEGTFAGDLSMRTFDK